MGKRGPPKGSGGRPPVNVDINTVTRAASIGCTIEEMAALCGISDRTFNNRMQDDPEFAAAVEMARGQGRATLRRYQWHRAANGSDTMLIWLGKNMLGQVDRQEITGADGGPMTWVVRAPSPVESADEWLRLHAPNPSAPMSLESSTTPASSKPNGSGQKISDV